MKQKTLNLLKTLIYLSNESIFVSVVKPSRRINSFIDWRISLAGSFFRTPCVSTHAIFSMVLYHPWEYWRCYASHPVYSFVIYRSILLQTICVCPKIDLSTDSTSNQSYNCWFYAYLSLIVCRLTEPHKNRHSISFEIQKNIKISFIFSPTIKKTYLNIIFHRVLCQRTEHNSREHKKKRVSYRRTYIYVQI